MRIKASKRKKITMHIKISKRKKITCFTFYAFYAFYAFYVFYACEITPNNLIYYAILCFVVIEEKNLLSMRKAICQRSLLPNAISENVL